MNKCVLTKRAHPPSGGAKGPKTLLLKNKKQYISADIGGSCNILYLMGPYNAGPNLTPAPLTPALITPVSNCAEFKKVFISAFNGNIRQKIS